MADPGRFVGRLCPMGVFDRLPVDRLGIWPARLTWFLLPLLAGPGIDDALADRSRSVATTVEIALWAGWFVGLIAVFAPSTASLTAYRLLAPSALAASIWLVAVDGTWDAAAIGAIAATAVALGVSLLPSTGDVMVNGSSYGPERRLALRPPAALLLGPIALTWLVMFLTTAGALVLLAQERWLVGLPLAAVAALVLWRGLRSMHQLARRWIVFVPAGFVIHDHWSMAESVLFQRTSIAGLGPVPLDKGELLDLSGGAPGLALLVELDEPAPIALRARSTIETFSAQRIVFTPTLPGRLLHEARVRGIRIAG